MKNTPLWIIFILCNINLCQCTHGKSHGKENIISGYVSRTGEPIAVYHLIQEYEDDHLNLYEKEVNQDNHIEWKAIENKDLDDYCRRYLYHCVPGRRTWDATGSKDIMKLNYTTPKYKSLTNYIVVVTCVYQIKYKTWHHLTRAFEPNCVYALRQNRGRKAKSSTFTISNKHCNFEHIDYTKKKRARRRIKKTPKIKLHIGTGQRIAVDELINEYEVEHEELHRREADEYNLIHWPYITTHNNLNEYCYKYLNRCVPKRNVHGVTGSWMFQKLKWRNREGESTEVVIVKCHIPDTVGRNYYFTRALDTNCTYALLRDGKCLYHPFLIIYRYCNIDPSNSNPEMPGTEVADTPYKKVKEEDSTIIELLQNSPRI